jgi:hypothetical protein
VFVACGLVQKADVYAVFLGRNEFEVVSDRVKLGYLKEIVWSEPGPGRTLAELIQIKN